MRKHKKLLEYMDLRLKTFIVVHKLTSVFLCLSSLKQYDDALLTVGAHIFIFTIVQQHISFKISS